jgi:CHAD domain-containing protein
MAKAREIEGLDCGAGVREGIYKVLQVRLEETCELRAVALDWSDIKGVHDMRVASRRLRSAVRDFKPYLRRRARLPRKRLKAIADALGAVRDEDVAIVALEKLLAEAVCEDAEAAGGIEELLDERRWRRESARRELEEEIGEAAIAKFQQKFIKRLELATGGAQPPDDSGEGDESNERESFREAGAEIVLNGVAELRKLSASLYRPLEAEPLHRMRITAKRLRYAVELFAPCWDEATETFAHEVAELQKSLGELHDCDVWIEDLGKRLGRHDRDADKQSARGERPAHSQQRSAAVWLIKHFVKERTKHYRDALTRWHEWETNDFFTRLAASLSSVRK